MAVVPLHERMQVGVHTYRLTSTRRQHHNPRAMVYTCGFEEAKEGTQLDFYHLKFYKKQVDGLKRIRKQGPSKVLISFRSQVITRADFFTLMPKIPLAPVIIDFAYTYLQSLVSTSPWPNRISLISLDRCNDFFVSGDMSFLDKLIFSQFVFIPVECPHGDWSLLVLCAWMNTGFYYNGYQRCQKGYFLAQTLLSAVTTRYGPHMNLVELKTPQQKYKQDSGVLLCEISALLIRRLIQAVPYHRISMGLGGTLFVVGAGRTLLMTLIAEVHANSTHTHNMASLVAPKRTSSKHHHYQEPRIVGDTHY